MNPDTFFADKKLDVLEVEVMKGGLLDGMPVGLVEDAYVVNFQMITAKVHGTKKICEPYENLKLAPGMLCRVWADYDSLETFALAMSDGRVERIERDDA